MLSLVTLAPDAVVPTHSHPHEQMGVMVSGTMEFTIEGETRVLSGNEMYFVPGGVPHAAKAGPGGAVALDAFSPPREGVPLDGTRPTERRCAPLRRLFSRRLFSRLSSAPPRPPTG